MGGRVGNRFQAGSKENAVEKSVKGGFGGIGGGEGDTGELPDESLGAAGKLPGRGATAAKNSRERSLENTEGGLASGRSFSSGFVGAQEMWEDEREVVMVEEEGG